MAARPQTARGAALAILGAILDEGLPLGEAMAAAGSTLSGLAPADRARAQRLVTTVLRHLEPADQLLAPHLRKAPPRAVRNVLRLAVVEMAIEAAPAHGVVNAAVDLVRHGNRTGHLTGLVNAVLRAVGDPAPATAALPPQRMPRWLRQPLVHAWGRDAVTAMEAVQALPPPLDLTLRLGATPPPGGTLLPTGSVRLHEAGQVSALEGYDAGAWWVQDAAAALPVQVLAPQPGETVLDLCAAPGGKTLQLAAAGSHVTALDISDPRLARLRANLARTGLAAEVVTADALHWQPPALFDAVLLDAPCTATGTLRRHPDLPFVKDGSELLTLLPLQAALLDRALAMVRPGGRVVFCTCSLLPEEGEAQVAAALLRHPGLVVEPVSLPGMDPAWITASGALRLRPDFWAERGGIDGFFIACLRVPAV